METYPIRWQVSALDDFSSQHLPVFKCNAFFSPAGIESDAPHSRTQPRFNSDSRIVYIEVSLGMTLNQWFRVDLNEQNAVKAVLLKIRFLVCIPRENLRSATLTWPWRPPGCSLAAALHRYSTRISFRWRILPSQRGRMKAAQRAPPSCQICTLLCKPSALKPSTLQKMERVMPTTFEKRRWWKKGHMQFCAGWNSTAGRHCGTVGRCCNIQATRTKMQQIRPLLTEVCHFGLL